MKLMEVRCCCDAHLIGHVRVPTPVGTNITFALGPRTLPQSFEAAKIGNFLELEVAHVGFGSIPERLAIKSHDVPLESLKRIPGFKEWK